MAGIISFGAYIPRRRLDRAAAFAALGWFNPALAAVAKGERAVAGWDEDSVTMAVEAARDCLTGIPRITVKRLLFASTSAPFADRLNAGIVKEALNLSDEVVTFDGAGSQRAGLGALMQSLQIAAGATGPALCVAAEKRRTQPGSEAELTSGDAAVAMLVGDEGAIAEMVGTHSLSVDFVDHFRSATAPYDYGWEKRWIRDEGYLKIAAGAISAALEKAGLGPDMVDAFIFPAPMKGAAEAVAKKIGIRVEAVRDSLAGRLGDAGVAQPLIMLAHALEEIGPGKTILVAAFGSGVDILILRTTDLIASLPPRNGVLGSLARRSTEANYIRFLFSNGHIDLDRGMRAEYESKQPLTALYRNRKAVLGLVGGRCSKTGSIQFPKSDISVNPEDHAIGTMEDYPLAEKTAYVLTHTADNLTYTPDPPALYGMIEFEGGGRMNVEFCDMEQDALEVGRPMRMMFRIKSIDEQRQFRRYFWKAAPAAD
jgi:3-hydroxy-3-methylglutaryl CoA synthase